jgi:hypothetical protein
VQSPLRLHHFRCTHTNLVESDDTVQPKRGLHRIGAECSAATNSQGWREQYSRLGVSQFDKSLKQELRSLIVRVLGDLDEIDGIDRCVSDS